MTILINFSKKNYRKLKIYLSSIVTGRGGKRNSLEKNIQLYSKGDVSGDGQQHFLLEFLYMFFQVFLTVETGSEMSEFSIG